MIKFTGSEFIMRSPGIDGIKKHIQKHDQASRPLSGNDFFTFRDDRDEEVLTESSRPEEDPVQLAFELALDDNDQALDDDDEIVWDPRYVFSLKRSKMLVKIDLQCPCSHRHPDCLAPLVIPS